MSIKVDNIRPAAETIPLDDISDVTITSVADNEILAYDIAISEWINQTAVEAELQPTMTATSPITLTDDTIDFDFSTNNTWTGTFKHQNATNSTTGFQILDADGGTPILNVDTTNERVGIGTASPTTPLEVIGDIKLSKDLLLKAGQKLVFDGI